MAAVSQKQHGRGGVGPPLTEDVSTGGRAVAHGLRNARPEQSLDSHDVPLPATPGDRIALVQQEARANMLGARQIRCLAHGIKIPKHPDTSAIHYLKEQT